MKTDKKEFQLQVIDLRWEKGAEEGDERGQSQPQRHWETVSSAGWGVCSLGLHLAHDLAILRYKNLHGGPLR